MSSRKNDIVKAKPRGKVKPRTKVDSPDPTGGGNPELRREAAELLLSLDRLMTIGTYYQPGHVRYQAVAQACEDTVALALQKRSQIDIELVENGLRLFEQNFPAGSREARRLYSLFEPLSMGVFTIKPGLSAEKLHEALTVLQQHKNSMAGTTTYEEIHISGLPAGISTVGRNLYMKTKKGFGPEGESSFDPNLIPAELLLPGADFQKSEGEFLKVMNEILSNKNLKKIQLGGGGIGDGKKGGKNRGGGGGGTRKVAGPKFDVDEWIPDVAIKSIRKILAALAGTNSDPMVFEHLIAHAKSALELSADPELVDLVFQKLRKNVPGSSKPKAKLIGKTAAEKRKKPGSSFAMSTDELRDMIDELEVPFGPHQNPQAQDRSNVLGICMHMMNSAPTDDLVRGINKTVRRMFSAARLGGPERSAAARVIAQVFTKDLTNDSQRILDMLWDPLWEYHPDAVGPIWLEVWRKLPPVHRERVWPYTVNDLLRGLRWKKPLDAFALYGAVSRVKTAGKPRLMYTLENLPSLTEGRFDHELFSPPPPLLFPVLQALIGSSISSALGPALHEHLVRLQTHPLSVIMLEAATEYHPGNRVVYQAILEQGVRERLTERMEELGGRLLRLALLRLPPGDRKETWITDAIEWVGKLAPEGATDVLNKIYTDKKLWVMPAWPKEVREAAEAAWLAMGDRTEEKIGKADTLGAYDVVNPEEIDDDIFSEPVMPDGESSDQDKG